MLDRTTERHPDGLVEFMLSFPPFQDYCRQCCWRKALRDLLVQWG